MSLAIVPMTFSADFQASLSAIIILTVAILPQTAAAIFPEWLQPSSEQWLRGSFGNPFGSLFEMASTIFPESGPASSPPATIELTTADLLLYTKFKMQELGGQSARSNRELNSRIKSLYDSLDAHAPFFAWVVTIGLRKHWERYGRMIESWLEDDFNISEQRKELERLFVEVAAVQDVNVSIENGHSKVQGTTVGARLVCLVIGGCNPLTDGPRKQPSLLEPPRRRTNRSTQIDFDSFTGSCPQTTPILMSLGQRKEGSTPAPAMSNNALQKRNAAETEASKST